MATIELDNFNSIKVQLKLQTEKRYLLICLFQFHKGTIRTNGLLPSVGLRSNFNSIKVRLEQLLFMRSTIILPISIP